MRQPISSLALLAFASVVLSGLGITHPAGAQGYREPVQITPIDPNVTGSDTVKPLRAPNTGVTGSGSMGGGYSVGGPGVATRPAYGSTAPTSMTNPSTESASNSLLRGNKVAQQAPAAPPVDAQGRVVLTKAYCEQLARSQPVPEGTYKPGVDVNGRPVAPADLPNSGASSTSVFGNQPIRSETYRDQVMPNGDIRRTTVGVTAVDPTTGQVTLNGQPLPSSNGAQPAQPGSTLAMCQKAYP